MSAQPSESDYFLRIIAIFKLIKAALFLCAAVGVLHFLHRDVETSLMQMMDTTHVDSDNRAAKWLLRQAAKLTSTRIGEISAICFVYGCLFATEGIGLYLRKHWAEWLVVVLTGSLLPIELYELFHKYNWAKLGVLGINLVILVYLITVIRKERK